MLSDADFVLSHKGGKDQTIPQFFIKQKKNNFKSAQAGHDVYDQKEYVRVIIPGDRNSIPEREVREEDKARWAKHYIAFKNGLTLAPDGMPLEKWPLIDINQIEHMKHWNVRTVEDLANLNDIHLQKLGMGARDLKSKAIVWLEQARDGSGVSRVVQENEELRAKTRSLEDQLKTLSDRVAAMQAPAEGGAGITSAAQPAAPAISAVDIQRMIAEGIAAATPPKNKGGRPKKGQTAEHELPPEGDED